MLQTALTPRRAMLPSRDVSLPYVPSTDARRPAVPSSLSAMTPQGASDRAMGPRHSPTTHLRRLTCRARAPPISAIRRRKFNRDHMLSRTRAGGERRMCRPLECAGSDTGCASRPYLGMHPGEQDKRQIGCTTTARTKTFTQQTRPGSDKAITIKRSSRIHWRAMMQPGRCFLGSAVFAATDRC